MGKIQKRNEEKQEMMFSDALLKFFIDRKLEHGMFYGYMESLGLATKTTVAMSDNLDFRKKYVFKTPYEEIDEMIKNEPILFNLFRKIEKEAEKRLYSYILAKEHEIKRLSEMASML